MPIRARYYSGSAGKGWWITTLLNWNTVITGGAITLGLSLADEQTDLSFDLIEKSLRSGEYSLSSWAPDGGWYEGSSYADYTSIYLSYELASLKSALGTTYGRENSRGVEDGTLYQYYLDSMSGGCNNPGDSATNHANSPGLFYADLYNSSVLARAIKEWHEKLNGTFGGVLDLLYLRPKLLKNEKIQLDLDKFFSGKETQMITTREGWDNKNQMYASWAGGGVQGGHNHCDVGSFVYDVNGYRFSSDLGAINYSYSGDPWDYFRRRAESHNVMVINPDKSGDFGLKKPWQDLDGWGTVKYVKKGSGGIVSAIDMQDVYKEQTSSYIRGFMTGDNRRTLTVRDEIVLKQNNSELYWNLMTLGDITITGTNTATITRGNQPVKLEFETNAAEFKLEKTAAEPYEFSPHPTDGKTNDGTYSRVLITMKASGKFYITAKLSPMGEPAELSGIPQGTIDEWQPPETPRGEYLDLPVKAGDVIMFKCGSAAFNNLEAVSGTEDKHVIYMSYGSGAKPVFYGSIDISSPSGWVRTGENIWECIREISVEACNFIFNGGEQCGTMVWEENELSSQGEWTDFRIGTAEGRTEEKPQKLLMYSQGNPGTVYKKIECATRKLRSLALLKSNVIVDGLCFKNNGVHAIAGAGENITVKNCDISFIGGCVWSKSLKIKFGNGIEFWDISKNIRIENNTFYDIYDSGVTHQGDENCQITENAHFDNNVFIKCGMGAYECRDLVPINTTFNNNICIDAGEGFSKNGETMPRKSEIWPQPMGHHVFIWRVDKPEKGGSLEIKNNLFYNAPYGAAVYSVASKEAEKQFSIDGNIYCTENMLLINRIGGKNYKSFDEYQKETGFDKNGRELK